MEAVPKPPARIADVAARAGVGIATVSRVVNDRGNVAAPTRERVLEAIRALEYRPSSVAQNLSLKRTLVIGVVLPFLTQASPIEPRPDDRVRARPPICRGPDPARVRPRGDAEPPRRAEHRGRATPAAGAPDCGVRRLGRPGARRARSGAWPRNRRAPGAVGDR